MVDHDVSYSRRVDKNERMLSFVAPAAFCEWLQQEAFRLDMSASQVMRAAILLGVPLIKSVRGLDRLTVEDIRPDRDDHVHQK